MENTPITKSAWLMLVIVIAAVTGYEIYVRSAGADIAYDDGPALWSETRQKVYEPVQQQVVFIGSSRIKYDLDIPTWKEQTGLDAIQLAMVGSSPLTMLEDLANDPDFKGRLVIDVTEPLFFSDAPHFVENPNEAIKYYHDRSLAQQASAKLNHVMESQLVFLDKDNYSMNAKLKALQLQNRPGVFEMPIFPMEFERTTFDRQSYMTEHFLADSLLINQVRGIWVILMGGPKGPPMTDVQIDGIILSVKAAVDKIKARGGEVVFARTPSSGPFLAGEMAGFPRARYWDRLLKITGCEGIHFADYPETAHFQCPEFSHLSKPDAKLFTSHFVEILSQKTHWITHSSENKTKTNL